MKYAKWTMASFYILISVFSFISMGGCEQRNYRDGNRGYVRGDNRGYDRHYYRDGRWYRHDSTGHDIVVTALSIGALIDSLPPRHTTIVVEGSQYYHDDNYYYRQSSEGGYVVVPAPRVVQSQPRSNYSGQGERGSNRNNEGNRNEHH